MMGRINPDIDRVYGPDTPAKAGVSGLTDILGEEQRVFRYQIAIFRNLFAFFEHQIG